GGAEHARAQTALADALTAIDVTRQAQTGDPALPAPAVKVLATLGREWEGLARHEQYPDAPLDNNTAERGLRNPVVGRKSYYGSGAVWAAELAGRAWTVTATVEKAGLDPLAYLTDYLSACAAAGGRAPDGAALEAFLPWAKAPPSTPGTARQPPDPIRHSPAPDPSRSPAHTQRRTRPPCGRLTAPNSPKHRPAHLKHTGSPNTYRERGCGRTDERHVRQGRAGVGQPGASGSGIPAADIVAARANRRL
ncbi:MAG: IS66 family transposase, partial [Pseudonocardiaceae bacterium]